MSHLLRRQYCSVCCGYLMQHRMPQQQCASRRSMCTCHVAAFSQDLPWERYYDLKPSELGDLIRMPKYGKALVSGQLRRGCMAETGGRKAAVQPVQSACSFAPGSEAVLPGTVVALQLQQRPNAAACIMPSGLPNCLRQCICNTPPHVVVHAHAQYCCCCFLLVVCSTSLCTSSPAWSLRRTCSPSPAACCASTSPSHPTLPGMTR